MPYTIEPPPMRMCIWQQNLNKSDKAHYDLINTPLHKSWDILALQEPYIDKLGNTKANSQWHVVYPTSHLANDVTCRSVMLLNAAQPALDINSWTQIHVADTNDITAIQLQTSKGRVTIFNIYNDCHHSNMLETLRRAIQVNHSRILGWGNDSMIWCGDFNRHHAMWDEERNHHLFMASATAEAQILISLLADCDMVMALPRGIPTLQAMNTKNWTRVDNVFVTEDLASLLVCCDTDPRQRGPGTDHVPIHTIIDTGAPLREADSLRNFRTVDWDEFREEMANQLELLPDPKILHTEEEYRSAVSELTAAIQATIEGVVPLSKPVPHLRRWWSKELGILKKQLNHLNNESYRYRAVVDHPSHTAHKEVRKGYGEAIKRAKEQHWQEFLESAVGPDLWAVNKYISRPAGDGGRQRIPTLKVVLESGAHAEVATNEEKGTVLRKQFFPHKPTESSCPDTANYPLCINYRFKLPEEQLRCQITQLQPYKAPGGDGIPNVVIKETAELIIPYLLQIFWATFALGTYSDKWRAWDTIVLQKPGKPRYDIPKAYRPIALMNMIGKLLSAVVAEDLAYMSEKHQLLPDTHFGGRQGRNTSDAMHYLANCIKGAWRRQKVAAVLFLDIEGAFPNAVTSQLLHNLRSRRIPEPYVTFVSHMLADRRTRLKFDGYTSDWMSVDNGIVQGDPLSMLLYLFFIAGLPATPEKGEAKLAYVDDANFYAEGDDFDDVYDSLWGMMEREHGGQEWSRAHNSRFEPSKMALVGFSRCRVKDPQRPGKTIPKPRPDFMLDNTVVTPVAVHKYLGVLFDQELRWREQAEHAVAKAAKWTLRFRRLARPHSGIKPKQMRQLYQAVAVPKFAYAADVWYTPVGHANGRAKSSGSVGVTRQLTSIQHLAVTAITGALCTTATDVMEAHVDILPIELLMHNICHRAATRLATLPESHPLHRPIRDCVGRWAKRHLSPLHDILRAYHIRQESFETISSLSRPPNGTCKILTKIASSREESKDDDTGDCANVRIYSDGSGHNKTAGAAAVLFKSDGSRSVLRYLLGPLEAHTTYEAEAVGVLLALHLATQERGAAMVSIKTDNQAVIQALWARKAKPGGYLLDKIHKLSTVLASRHVNRRMQVTLSWISSHDGVEGNERADVEAKEATEDGSSLEPLLPPLLQEGPLPTSITAAGQTFRGELSARWRAIWGQSPHFVHASKVDPKLPAKSFLSLVNGISRAQASIIFQLRSRHALLQKYLHRISKAELPTCPLCELNEETVHHYLFDCPAHSHARFSLAWTLGRKSKSLSYVLSHKKATKPLLKFIQETGRFRTPAGQEISGR